MAKRNRITEKNPSTGALPSEQTAENAKKKQGSGKVWQIDQMLYQLVERNVQFAGEQFGENLKFNSETLANVLYDNIYKLLGEKFDEDQFIQEVANKLLDEGCVVKVKESAPTEDQKQEPVEEEVVDHVDPKDYQELVSKVDAAVKLVQANKLTIFKKLNELQETSPESTEKKDDQILKRRNIEIDNLLAKIKGNQQKIQAHVFALSNNNKEIGESISAFQKALDNRNLEEKSKSTEEKKKLSTANGKIVSEIQSKLTTIGKNAHLQSEYIDGLANPKKTKLPGFGKLFQPKKKKPVGKLGKLGKIKKIQKKPTTVLGKALAGVQMVGKAVRSAYRGAKATVKFGFKTAKFAAKSFYKASKFTGNLLRGGIWATKVMFGLDEKSKKQKNFGDRFGKNTAIGRMMRNANASMLKAKRKMGSSGGAAGKVKGKNAGAAKAAQLFGFVNTFAPGKIVAKLGWKAVKFIGKKIWSGIKKLASKVLDMFKTLFGMASKFVNTMGYWLSKLGAGIKDKAYRFIIKPVASLVVTIFNFVQTVVMSPIKFIQWVIPTLFDRFHESLDSISQSSRRVLKSTWGIFKKILFNPITIALLIGALFIFVVPHLIGWLNGMTGNFRETIIPAIKSFVSTMWNMLKGIGVFLFEVGKFLYDAIKWITNPKGPVARVVAFLIEVVMASKKFLKDLMKATGKDNIDILCMFIAGDLVGIAIHAIAGAVVKLWEYLKNTKLMKFILGIVNSIVAFGKLLTDWYTAVPRMFLGAALQLIKGNYNKIIPALTKPWKDLWQSVKDLMGGKAFKEVQPIENYEKMVEDPVARVAEKANNAQIAVRSLQMKGHAEVGLHAMEQLANANKHNFGNIAYGSLLPKIQNMNKLHQMNAKQVKSYEDFITKIWEMGQGNDDLSENAMQIMLESPDISQKLLSVFFYYNPQTGKTMMLQPSAYIGQFIENIRQMVSQPKRDDQETFKAIIMAFDQLNKERGGLINQHGDFIANFSQKIIQFGRAEAAHKNSEVLDILTKGNLRQMLIDFNKGDLFNDFAVATGRQLQKGDAKSSDVKSITGEKLGSNVLLKVPKLTTPPEKGVPLGQEKKDYEAPKQEESKGTDKIGNIVFPPGVNPPPIPSPDLTVGKDGLTMAQRWLKHQNTRGEMIRSGMSTKDVDAQGFEALTLEQFKQRYNEQNPPTPKEVEETQENKERRLASLKLAKDIQAFHNQGSVANAAAFKLGKKPSILSVETENLEHRLLMFSPEWQMMQGVSKSSDDELLLELNAEDKEAAERIRKAREEAEAKKAEEEREKKREQEILDYSAKVEGGFIEVKIGEDTTAMMEAYAVHMRKRSEAIRNGISTDKLDEMGLYNFTPEEWKRYYRKMHGLPEDGIKRIPFEGKRKERNINWDARFPLSPDELSKYGIEMSKEGPVMIPLDKAMEATASILKGAKTIYAIRDGLEVMRQGLSTEAKALKKRREEGVPTAVVNTGGEGGEGATTPTPPDQSHYAQVG